MLRRIFWSFLFCAAIWLGGILWFAGQIPLQSPEMVPSADAIVVLTGGKGRLAYGLKLLSEGKGEKLFITGVEKNVTLNALLRSAQADSALPLPNVPRQSIVLDYRARNTIGNAAQAVHWLHEQHFHSILLVTTNYHLPRSLLEFREVAPDITIYPVPVFSGEFMLNKWQSDKNTRMMLLVEYHKFLAAALRHWLIAALHRS